MGHRSVRLVESPVRQGFLNRNTIEDCGDRLVPGHRDRNRIARRSDIASPIGESVAWVGGGGHDHRGAVGVFRKVWIPDNRPTYARDSVQPPIARRQIVGSNLLIWMLEKEINITIRKRVVVYLYFVN